MYIYEGEGQVTFCFFKLEWVHALWQNNNIATVSLGTFLGNLIPSDGLPVIRLNM